MKLILQILFIICVPALLVTASVSAAMNCRQLYEYGFHKNHITEVTGLAPAELTKAAKGLISYFNSGEEYINVVVTKDGQPFTLFNQKEVLHLKDVKTLFLMVYKILIGTAIYAILFASLMLARRQDRRKLYKGMLFGGGLTLALMAALGIMIAVNFDGFFLEFHLLSFSNSFWELNPATDYLIMLFPQDFWMNETVFIAAGTAAGAVIMGGFGWWLLKRERRSRS
jgi:integral membrane protein (TIGR01906 family)